MVPSHIRLPKESNSEDSKFQNSELKLAQETLEAKNLAQGILIFFSTARVPKIAVGIFLFAPKNV
jgi:hypothetical protein